MRKVRINIFFFGMGRRSEDAATASVRHVHQKNAGNGLSLRTEPADTFTRLRIRKKTRKSRGMNEGNFPPSLSP
jgi:hypothetical protein